MNIFAEEKVALEYDIYYKSELGKEIDLIEKQAISHLLEPITPGHLLEIGCGTAHWTSFFSKCGFQITATDVSAPMLALAKTKDIPNTQFLTADVCNLPFPDNHFDQVAAITSLEFCGNIKQAIQEVKRVLKPSGLFIAGCLNSNSELGKVKDQDPVLKHGEFMSKDELHSQLSILGEATIIECAKLSADFKILDLSNNSNSVEGVFLASAVQKK